MPKRTTKYSLESFPNYILSVKSGRIDADGKVRLEVKVTEEGADRNIAEGIFVADTSVTGFFEDFYVTPSKRRQGIATAVYDKIEEIGFHLRESGTLDGDGQLFWENRNEMQQMRRMQQAMCRPAIAAGM